MVIINRNKLGEFKINIIFFFLLIFFQSLKIKIEGQYYRYCMQFWLQYTAKIWIWDPQIVTAATALSSSKFGFLVAWNSTKTLLTKKLLIISSHAFSRLVDRYVMISDLVFHWLVVFFMTGLFSEESSLVSN